MFYFILKIKSLNCSPKKKGCTECTGCPNTNRPLKFILYIIENFVVFYIHNCAVPFRLAVKIGVQTLLTQVIKVCLVWCRLFFSIVVIWLRRWNLFFGSELLLATTGARPTSQCSGFTIERRMRWAVGLGRSAFKIAATAAANDSEGRAGMQLTDWLTDFIRTIRHYILTVT